MKNTLVLPPVLIQIYRLLQRRAWPKPAKSPLSLPSFGVFDYSNTIVSRYDHRTRTVILAPDATVYVRFHEIAHKDQHDERAPIFLAWLLLHRLPVIGRWVTQAVELDAYWRARASMCAAGLWTEAVELDAMRRLLTYFLP